MRVQDPLKEDPVILTTAHFSSSFQSVQSPSGLQPDVNVYVRVPERSPSPGTKVPGSCELPGVAAGN